MIQGGSAGGLLMGGVVNMRPDLFKAAVAQVPFVDVINTMLDASLPLTTSEYIEWGNPNKKAEFEYMIKYSPYDNIKAQRVSGAAGAGVVERQPGAVLGRARSSSPGCGRRRRIPIRCCCKTNMGAGHGGSSGRYDALRETAFTYAFVLWQMGLTGGSHRAQRST